ncbi:hypothetical protein BDV24DRAFT_142509 [Aspergillus arachidicola]|uniref:Uncharacterized protein n=1 Tax=Aspergillus arachidicola TaxID=656916 RepID=A0A5N6XUP8_9EURO|nr:hypothetical protein BDV24DRAFT_142509 [Aspergillus arachidicola]
MQQNIGQVLERSMRIRCKKGGYDQCPSFSLRKILLGKKTTKTLRLAVAVGLNYCLGLYGAWDDKLRLY